MTGWLLFRWLKFVSLGLFAVGCLGAISVSDQKRRLTLVHWVASSAFLGLCLAGYGLMKATHRSLSETWLWLGFLLGFSCFHGAALWAHKTSPRWTSAGTTLGAFLAGTGVMVMRHSEPKWLWSTVVLSFVLGFLLCRILPLSTTPTTQEDLEQATYRWFRWLARLEGLSLLFMLGVSVPIRVIWGIRLDGGEGWIGWSHGLAVLLYTQALLSLRSVTKLPWKTVLLGLFASFLPFGTFLFDSKVIAPLERKAAP